MKYTAEGTITLAVSVTWRGDGSDAEPWDAAAQYMLDAFWEWVNAAGFWPLSTPAAMRITAYDIAEDGAGCVDVQDVTDENGNPVGGDDTED